MNNYYCILGICLKSGEWLNVLVAIIALFVSLLSLIVAVSYARKTFRPIVSVMVKTHSGGSVSISYNLQILNSGSIPAKEIRLKADHEDIEKAIANQQFDDRKDEWLACFTDDSTIMLLQNGEKVSCSFGLTRPNDSGFWHYGASIPVTIEYKGWFGKEYRDQQIIQIKDSDSFTGYFWSA